MTYKSVLVLTYEHDPHADRVCSHLLKNKVKHYRIDTDKLDLNNTVTFDSKNLEFKIKSKNNEIILDPSWNIWNRRVLTPENNSLDSELKKIIENETKAMWRSLLTCHDGNIVNNPECNYKADNKITQLKFAKNYGNGISIPETILTNDPDYARAFWNDHKDNVCFKLQKSVVIEKNDKYYGIYTNMVNEENMQQINLIRNHPHLFQVYQDKAFEVRIVAFGEQSIGTAIYSQKSELSRIDFRRYDFENVPYKNYELTDNVSGFCKAILNHFNLHFGVLDFIYSENKGFIFLEINPNGQWLWLEEKTDHPISRDLSKYLATL